MIKMSRKTKWVALFCAAFLVGAAFALLSGSKPSVWGLVADSMAGLILAYIGVRHLVAGRSQQPKKIRPMHQPGWKPDYTHLKQEIRVGLAIVIALFALIVAAQTRLWFVVIGLASSVTVYVLEVRKQYRVEVWDKAVDW